MEKRLGIYVGVTGFMDLLEVSECSNAISEARNDGDDRLEDLKQLLMVGVLVSSKTLDGKPNKRPGRYPQMPAIKGIFEYCNWPDILNTIHYHTDDRAGLYDQVCRLVEVADGRLHAIQFNVRWPNHVTLVRIARRFPWLRIIVQIGHKAIADVTDGEHTFIGDAVRAYREVVDDFLFDPSGGLGRSLDLDAATSYVNSIPQDSCGRGIAGGFDADSVVRTTGAMQAVGTLLNLDAEGRLRTPKDEGDKMDLTKAKTYVRAAVKAQRDGWRALHTE